MKAGRARMRVNLGCCCMSLLLTLGSSESAARATAAPGHQLFEPGTRCFACHNNLATSRGEDISLGSAWRPTMMANSARDPYWQAGVRRETLEHPALAAAIQDECSKCHLPMATTAAHAQGRLGEVFAHFNPHDSPEIGPETALARDGVSCSLCHQIQAKGLGQRASLTGGFVIDTRTKPGHREEFGPYAVDAGRAHVMRSASHMLPVKAEHIGTSEFCATCHTLYTHSLDAQDRVIGELPEQVPYQEWLHSAYRNTRTCQSCHMPAVNEPMPIASVAGQTRPRLRRHDFVGGNSFIQDVFARFGSELFADTTPARFEVAAQRTREHLSHEAAELKLDCSPLVEGRLGAKVAVRNLTGHKLPTAYPSRRVWLHVTVRTARGSIVFESGALNDDGSIVGNDNDLDASKVELHHTRIERPSQVAIYESILGRTDGRVTTGLLAASQYLKDNRLLPNGFDKSTASADVAVHGAAIGDPDFQGGMDVVTYEIAVPNGSGPISISVELLYQPIGFRWAENLRSFDAFEPRRFVRYYKALSRNSATILAKAQAVVP